MIENKIYCGDCEILLNGMQNSSIDLIVTDIPYGIDYKSHKQNYDTRGISSVIKNRPDYFNTIIGDNELSTKWLVQAHRILKDNTAIYIFCHWSKWHELAPAVEDVEFKVKNMIILNKSNHGMGDLKGQYAPKHELLLFAVKGRHLLHFPDKRMNDVWNVKVRYSGSKRHHPNEKPLEWIMPAILNSSNKGDIVLDPFCGSGSIGVAAKKCGRKYCLIDIDEQWTNVTLKRVKSHDIK